MTRKTEQEIKLMRTAGLILWETHQKAKELATPGTMTKEIDQAVEDFIRSKGAKPLFKGVPGEVPYPASACISVNEEIVHGIPSTRKLKSGDIVSIDIGVELDGWCSDAAVTWPVGDVSEEQLRLLRETEDILRYAIRGLSGKTRWSHIAKEMESKARSAGFTVFKNSVGHGIGRSLWEQPEIPNYFDGNFKDFSFPKGAVFAIEPMITAGSSKKKGVGGSLDHRNQRWKPQCSF